MSYGKLASILLVAALAGACLGPSEPSSAQPDDASSEEAVAASPLTVAAEAVSHGDGSPLFWEIEGDTTVIRLTGSSEAYVIMAPEVGGGKGLEMVGALCPPDGEYLLSGVRDVVVVEWRPDLECSPGDLCLPCTLGADCTINPCPPGPGPP